jgi:capreomycidine synthase
LLTFQKKKLKICWLANSSTERGTFMEPITLADNEAHLEKWMRQYYFDTDLDLGSSGVQSFSMAELRELLEISQGELDAIVFDDSRTLGDPQLRAAIAAHWGNLDPEQVMATNGSTEANYLIMNALLRPGDEVIVLDPLYQQLYGIAQAIGCQLRSWRLRPEAGFAPNIDDLRRLITSRTRMVIVNFPHNPTGASISLSQQEELIEIVADAGAYLIWDAAFAEMIYEGSPLPNPSLHYERCVSFGTLSKAYGLPGLRVGWCVAPRDVLARCERLRDYVSLALSPLVEVIARRAIEKADLLIRIRLRQLETNLKILSAWIESQDGRVRWTRPLGGACGFVQLPFVSNTEGFCHQLAQQHRVLLVPGTCFGYPQYARLGFGGATENLEEGLSRLAKLIDTIAAPEPQAVLVG